MLDDVCCVEGQDNKSQSSHFLSLSVQCDSQKHNVTSVCTVLNTGNREHGDKVMDIVCDQQAGAVKDDKYIQNRTKSHAAEANDIAFRNPLASVLTSHRTWNGIPDMRSKG
jgi:hypothetical protein